MTKKLWYPPKRCTILVLLIVCTQTYRLSLHTYMVPYSTGLQKGARLVSCVSVSSHQSAHSTLVVVQQPTEPSSVSICSSERDTQVPWSQAYIKGQRKPEPRRKSEGKQHYYYFFPNDMTAMVYDMIAVDSWTSCLLHIISSSASSGSSLFPSLQLPK